MATEVNTAIRQLLELGDDVFDHALVVAGELARLQRENELLTYRCARLMEQEQEKPAAAKRTRSGRPAPDPSTPHPELRHELSDDPDALISRVDAARKYLGVDPKNSVWRSVEKRPGWPEPVKVSRKNVRYREPDVKRYLASLVGGSSGTTSSPEERGAAALAMSSI